MAATAGGQGQANDATVEITESDVAVVDPGELKRQHDDAVRLADLRVVAAQARAEKAKAHLAGAVQAVEDAVAAREELN